MFRFLGFFKVERRKMLTAPLFPFLFQIDKEFGYFPKDAVQEEEVHTTVEKVVETQVISSFICKQTLSIKKYCQYYYYFKFFFLVAFLKN